MKPATNTSTTARRYARAIGLRLVVAVAILFLAQDKIILRPGTGGDVPGVSVSPYGWASDWLEDGKYRGKVYSTGAPNLGTVLVFHGNAGTAEDRESLAQQLANRGLRVVLVEYPGFGRREGWATIGGAVAASVADLALAQKRWPGPLYIVGESFGAGVAAQVARRNPEAVKGVLLFTPWDSLKEVVDGKFGGVPVGLLLRSHLDSKEALSGYAGRIVIVAASEDTLIPATHAKALAHSLPKAAYRELAGAGHNTWPEHLTQPDWSQLVAEMTGTQQGT